MISQKVLNWALICWLCLESGQFVKTLGPWGQDALFWPLWISICLVVILSVLLLDSIVPER